MTNLPEQLNIINQSHDTIISNFNIGQLYQESIIWLGKRYENKYESATAVNHLKPDTIFSLPEVSVLKKLAYEEFINDRIIIEDELLERYCNSIAIKHKKTNVEQVKEFGLLTLKAIFKKEESSHRLVTVMDDMEIADISNVETKVFKYAHLSFLEYLTAYELKDKLLSDDIVQYTEAAEFIANHGNEPRYLMVLKFLVELVTTNNNGDQNSQQILINRFWEAVTCNVDGVLELGVRSKVTLLINLLSQAYQGNEIDSRIPNRNRLIDFIDHIVLKDLFVWEDTLKSSGYMSDRIKGTLLDILDGNLNASKKYLQLIENELKVEIDVTEKEKNIQIVVVNQEVIDTSENRSTSTLLLSNDEIVVVKQVISMVTTLASKLGGSKGAKDIFNKILNSKMIFTNKPNSDNKQIVPKYERNNNMWQIKKVAFISLGVLLNVIDMSMEELKELISELSLYVLEDNLGEVAINLIVKLITYDKKSSNKLLLIAVKELMIPLISSSNFILFRYAIDAIIQIVSESVEMCINVIELLGPLLSSSCFFTTMSALATIDQIASKVELGIEGTIRVIDLIVPLILSPDSYIVNCTVKSISQIALKIKLGVKGSIRIIMSIILLLPSLNFEPIANNNSSKVYSRLEPEEKLYKIIINRIIGAFAVNIFNSDFNIDKDSTALLIYLLTILLLEIEIEVSSSMLVVEALIPYLSSSDTNVISKAVASIVQVALVGEEATLVVIELLVPLLSASNLMFVLNAAKIIGQIVSKVQLKSAMSLRVMESLTPLLTTFKLAVSSSDFDLFQWVVDTIDQVVLKGKLGAEGTIKVIEILISLLSLLWYNDRFKSIVNTIVLMTSKEELGFEVLELLIPLLSSSRSLPVDRAVYTIGKLALECKLEIRLYARVIELLGPLISSSNIDIVTEAVDALGKLLRKGKLGAEGSIRMVELLVPLLSSPDYNKENLAFETINQIISEWELGEEGYIRAVELFVPLLSSTHARTGAIAFSTTIKITTGGKLGANVSTSVIESLVPLLSSSVDVLAKKACVVIYQIASETELGTEGSTRVVKMILLILASLNSLVVNQAVDIIGQIASHGKLGTEVSANAIKLLGPFLSSSDSDIVKNTVCTISRIALKGELGSEGYILVIDLLFPLSSLSNFDIYRRAVSTIFHIASGCELGIEGSIRVIELLISLLSTSDSYTAEGAATAINQIASKGELVGEGTIKVIELLVPLLSSSDSHIVIMVATTVSNLISRGELGVEGSLRAIELLVPFLSSPVFDISKIAVNIISQIASNEDLGEEGHVKVKELIVPLLSNSDSITTQRASAVINQIISNRSCEVSQVRSTPALELLVSSFLASDSFTVIKAIDSIPEIALEEELGAEGCIRAIELLVPLLSSTDSYIVIKTVNTISHISLLGGLGVEGSIRAIELLVPLLYLNSNIGGIAVYTIEELISNGEFKLYENKRLKDILFPVLSFFKYTSVSQFISFGETDL